MKKLFMHLVLFIFLFFQIQKNKRESRRLLDLRCKEIEECVVRDDSIPDSQFEETLLREIEAEGLRILADLELKNKKLILWAQQKVDTL